MHERLADQIREHLARHPAPSAELAALLERAAGALAEADALRCERDQATDALRRARERERLIAAATDDTVWEWEPDTGGVRWSGGITTVFGYPAAEVEPTRAWWAERLHPDDRDRVLSETEQALRSRGESWTTEYRFRHADGGWVAVADRAHVQRGADGRPERAIGAMADVTVQRAAERALRDSERQFRGLAETIAAATFIYRGTGFLYVNAAATQLTGFTRDELLGIEFWSLVHPEHREMVRERGMARQRGESTESRYQFKIVTRGGEERWVDFTAGVIQYRGEQAVLGTAFDITPHKRAEEELGRQALVFENLFDAVVITDPRGRVVGWNPAAERIYGYTAAQAHGQTAALWLRPDEAEWIDRTILEGLAREGRWSGEIHFRRRDGREGVSETTVVPLLDARGRRIGQLGVNRDITDRRLAEEALRSSEERYRLMVEGSEQVFFYVHDRDGVFEYLSPSVADVLGHSAEWLRGRSYHAILAGGAADGEVDAHTRATLTSRDGLSTYPAVVRHRDGRTVVLELTETAVMRDGRVVGVQGFARDITERRRAEEALRESELRYRTLFEESRDAIYMTTVDGRFVDANEAALELFGSTREALLERDVFDVYVHAADRERFQDEVLRTGFVRDYEVRLARRDGALLDCLLSATVRRGPEGEVVGYQGIIHDITERKQAEAQLAYGALHDALTGLPNRALFVDRLQHAIERVRRAGEAPFAVLFLDLDRFKVINDSLGHGVGDELLSAIATRLAETVRPGDTVARFGGDEFTILLDDIPGAVEASHVAERVLNAFAAPFPLERHEVFASASVGIALSTTGSADPEELLRNADAALSRAKVLGKARYEVFDRAMHAQAMQRLRMETDLRRALERGEFRVFYQPVVELATGRICGFEGLLRWMHPQRGMVAPAEFIPVAEEMGLILPLGRWVVERVCRDAAGWRAPDGTAPSVGVNLSAREFSQSDLVDHVEWALREHGVAPGRLKVEITESVILEDAEAAQATLARLRELGVALYMDDFGTGYSSLGYLHRFPLDALKVDRSFVAEMDTEHRNARLVEAIVGLARTLGVQVVAEGIASGAQLAALRELGCDFGQGFFFAEPLPHDEALALLARSPTW